ncbi:MAG: hypothetical protein JO266_16615 [Acidobacteria bacterium]|nr:hypothetical protein [Acidobacteriota bacterium]
MPERPALPVLQELYLKQFRWILAILGLHVAFLAAAAPKIADLRLVATKVTGELVYKYDRESRASIFVIHFDPIVSSHVRHNVSL